MANNKNEKDKEKVKNNKTFFKDFKAELKRVTWPTTKQLINNTIGVIVIAVIVAIIVFILDICFETVNKYGINGLKGIVQTENSISAEELLENESNETADSNTVTESSEENATSNEVSAEENTTTEAADTTNTTEQ